MNDYGASKCSWMANRMTRTNGVKLKAILSFKSDLNHINRVGEHTRVRVHHVDEWMWLILKLYEHKTGKWFLVYGVRSVVKLNTQKRSVSGSFRKRRNSTVIETWKPFAMNRHVGTRIGTLVSWGMLTLRCVFVKLEVDTDALGPLLMISGLSPFISAPPRDHFFKDTSSHTRPGQRSKGSCNTFKCKRMWIKCLKSILHLKKQHSTNLLGSYLRVHL